MFQSERRYFGEGTASGDLGDDAEGVQAKDEERRRLYQLLYAEWIHWEFIYLSGH